MFTIVEGLHEFRNPKNGFTVLELHYSADPLKRSQIWKEQESVGVSLADWAREYELSWITKTGRPVYSGLFSRDHHVFGPNSRRGDTYLPRDAKLVVGYDLGPTASRMAASFVLIEFSFRKWIIDEAFVSNGSVDEFLDAVEARLLIWSDWGPAVHVVDPTAIESLSRIEEKACADVMRLRGINPIPGERSFIKRRKCVEDSLMKSLRGIPDLNVHERCVMHIEGFEGGYCYPEVSPSRGGGYGSLPIKNGYSDIHDANQYAVSRQAEVVAPPPKPSKIWASNYSVKSPGRYRGRYR